MKNRILLAEDDKNLGFIIKNELEDENFLVDLVQNGVEAVLSFIEKRQKIVFLDIKMPKLNGINALRIIKKIDPDITVIAFSGNARQEEIAEILQVGAEKCLIKPFEIQELIFSMKERAYPPC